MLYLHLQSLPGKLYKKRAKRAIEFLEKKGNIIIFGSLFKKSDFYRSGTIKERAKEINTLLKKDIDILMASIGGFNTSSILPYIQYHNVKDGLIICGFSDTTALLNAIINFCPKARVLYGPALFPNFGDFEIENCNFTYNSMINRIENNFQILQKPIQWTEEKCNWENFEKQKSYILNNWEFYNGVGKITGRLIGGNLSTIIANHSTKYGIKIKKDDILMIEDSQKTIAEWERNLAFLQLNNIFSKIKALIVSKHELFDDQKTNKTPLEVLNEILMDKQIPIVYNTDFGHTRPMIITELNKLITIDFDQKTIIQ